MPVTHQTRTITTQRAVVGLLAAGLLVGCSSESAPASHSSPSSSESSSSVGVPQQPVPTGKSGRPRGGFPSEVDEEDAGEVSRAFAIASVDQDTRIDQTPFDAQHRAAHWAGGDLARELRQAGAQPGGADWNEMASHDGYTDVEATRYAGADDASDQTRRAERGWVITTVQRDSDDWRGERDSQVIVTTLARASTDDPWRVLDSDVTAGGDDD